jgi:hypothetical protein
MFDGRRYGLAAIACILGMFAAAASSGASETPAGIVMSVTGKTDPPLSPMTEIAAGQSVSLGDGVTLTFLDYARCKLVTVSGGTLTLSATAYKTDGHVESETDGPCPQVYSVQEPGDASRSTGGLVMRGGLGPPRWPVNTQFLLTGPRAGDVRAAAIYPEDHPDTPAATLAVGNGRAVEPQGAPLPSPNARYLLRLTTNDGRATREITFIGAAPSDAQPVVVLRLD